MRPLPHICNTDDSSENQRWLVWSPFGISYPQVNTCMGIVCSGCRENSLILAHIIFKYYCYFLFLCCLVTPAIGSPGALFEIKCTFPLLGWCECYLLPILFPSRLACARMSHVDILLQHPLFQETSFWDVSLL